MKNILIILICLFSIGAKANQYFSYDFGNVPVNSYHSTSLAIYTDDFPAEILGMQMVGDGSLSYNTNCPRQLPPRFQCTVQMNYWPFMRGFTSGNMYIYTSGNNIQVSLFGRAYDVFPGR